jgi:hypothetical protein
MILDFGFRISDWFGKRIYSLLFGLILRPKHPSDKARASEGGSKSKIRNPKSKIKGVLCHLQKTLH